MACVAEVLGRATRGPSNLSHLGFYVVAPKSQVEGGVFEKHLKRDSICEKVKRRVRQYKGREDEGEKNEWYVRWFEPTLQQIAVHVLKWEDLIGTIREQDPSSAALIAEFYQQCLRFNLRSSRVPG